LQGNEIARQSKTTEISSSDKGSRNSLSVSMKAQKVANLLRSLNEVLEEDGMDGTLDLIGDEAMNRCMDLRSSLLKSKSQIESMNTSLSSQRASKQISLSHEFQNIPKLISPMSVTPWKSSTIPSSLPPLPEVLDPTLAAAAFIHQSCGSGIVSDITYERLEWIGDIYLELTATLLLAQTFPSLNPGKLSQLRERLVKNVTLAEFAKQYGFDKRARLASNLTSNGPSKLRDNELVKIYGDIFEAYTAAVILSDPADGVRRASEWLKDLWGQALQKEIIDEERNKFKLDSPLWRLRGSIGSAAEVTVEDKTQVVPLNFKDQLQKAIGAKGIRIRYDDIGQPRKDPNSNLPLFTVGVYLDGWGEKGKLLGTGKANGKKEAGMQAAKMALQSQKMMKPFIEKKKLADAQLAMEDKAMEKHENV
jgi:ribonuclease-3